MRKLKQIAVLLSILNMVSINMLGVNAHADAVVESQEECVNECKGDPGFGMPSETLEEQLENFLNNPELTEEQKLAAKSKVEQAMSFRDNAMISAQSLLASYPNVTIGVTAFKQENSYYCGPATTRQTMKYLGASVPGGYNLPSQSYIASDLGTTTAGTEWYMIRDYINGFTFMGVANNYIEYNPTSVSDMESTIYSTLTATNKTAPILQVNTAGNPCLGYQTGGHYLNVSGIRTSGGKNQFRLTDPYREWKGKSPTYYVETSEIYEITCNHWARHFLY